MDLRLRENMITLHIYIEKDLEAGGFVAFCPALPGCMSQGETEEEVLKNIKEAVTLWLETQDELVAKASKKQYKTVRELCLNI